MKATISSISILILMLYGFLNQLTAQNNRGTIEYESKMYWTNRIEKTNFIPEEDKKLAKLNFGRRDGYAQYYNLTFTDEESYYTYGKENTKYSWSWKKDPFFIKRNYRKGETFEQLTLEGDLFKISGEIPKVKWKILSDIREVAGYFCIKAEAYDTIRDNHVVAWFTNEIPVSAGPEGYGGLPGMIMMLEINENVQIIEATKVDFQYSEYEMPKKVKGKELSKTEYNSKMVDYIERSKELKRMPWAVRYAGS